MENKFTIHFLFFLCALLTAVSCDSQQQKFASPPGYNFSKPRVYKMPDPLREISGIAFNKGRNDTIYAEQDEEGKVFHFKLGDPRIQITRFWKKGDFEDISICNDFVIMLRSDGVLFTFPLSETAKPDAGLVKTIEGLLPAGEYEGLASTASDGKVFVLCKHCKNEKTSKQGFGYIFQLNAAGNLIPCGNFEYNVKEIEALAGIKKINFHPSALTLNPLTREWYILSAVNMMLVITNETWKVKAVYLLNPSLFTQPEGITFDGQQNLYISNERNQSTTATILAFAYQGK
jgi:hypothetical protein